MASRLSCIVTNKGSFTMNYNKYSKLEINELVASALGMQVCTDYKLDNALSGIQEKKHPDSVWAKKDNKPWEQFCFTDSPLDWVFLVESYSINLTFDTCQVHANSYFSDTSKVSKSRKDIGLAISIAFLKMKNWQASNVEIEKDSSTSEVNSGTNLSVFFNDIERVCREHNISIAHEDAQGQFVLERFKKENMNWLKDADTDELEVIYAPCGDPKCHD